MRNYVHTSEELAARYPRLLRSMRFAAILSDGEAVSALQMAKAGETFAGEAVNHYGGVPAVIRGALRCRHFVRRLRPNPRPVAA